ncbi:ribosomal protein l9 n-terminal domain [Holotrichia oblita]|uniref:Ribosomal protein l9 n-terminal domain n=1 Tax=Holotrichia oblita TaxID=644536 RepID=A0ACB9TNC0_HOLOL|nr:ribosomal protein l9 n-terminal domain [Holotrichia oblita]
MWKSCAKGLSVVPEKLCLLQENIQNISRQQIRTTFILKRRTPPLLHKKGGPPKRLKNKHYVYDLVQDTNTLRQPNIDVILTEYVDGLGSKGERVSVKPYFAYNQLLLPCLAVYATPENIKNCDVIVSLFQTINIFSNKTISVVMNKEMPWTLQPWHVKASFRKCGYHVPEDTITMPTNIIQGPNMEFENKEFFVMVTVSIKIKYLEPNS